MEAHSSTTRKWLIFTIPVFLLLAAYFIFLFFTSPAKNARAELQPLATQWYAVDTARGDIRKNSSIVGNCHICHAFWVPIPRSNMTSSPRFAHGVIQLEHGNNNRCYNCHLITDRNKYVADDGSAIMSQTPEKLCSRCHGLIYNDWQAGTHGKWTGSATPANPFDRITYTCTECHDPHKPAFHYTTIAPPPVWPKKYIRTESKGIHSGPLSNILIGEQPKETF